MSETGPLFRDEALEFLARHRGPGELVRASTTWTDRAYWGLLGLVVGGLAASLVVRVESEPLLYVLVPALKTLAKRLHV